MHQNQPYFPNCINIRQTRNHIHRPFTYIIYLLTSRKFNPFFDVATLAFQMSTQTQNESWQAEGASLPLRQLVLSKKSSSINMKLLSKPRSGAETCSLLLSPDKDVFRTRLEVLEEMPERELIFHTEFHGQQLYSTGKSKTNTRTNYQNPWKRPESEENLKNPSFGIRGQVKRLLFENRSTPTLRAEQSASMLDALQSIGSADKFGSHCKPQDTHPPTDGERERLSDLESYVSSSASSASTTHLFLFPPHKVPPGFNGNHWNFDEAASVQSTTSLPKIPYRQTRFAAVKHVRSITNEISCEEVVDNEGKGKGEDQLLQNT